MLGMPDTDHSRLRVLSGTLVRSLEPVTDPELIAATAAADEELSERIAEVIDVKRCSPGDDLLTALIQADDDGDVLSDEELVSQVVLLYVAGHETTVNLIANGAVALLRNPDQFALLREHPELDENAVEELLRYDSPVQQSRRITLAPYGPLARRQGAQQLKRDLIYQGAPWRRDRGASSQTDTDSSAGGVAFDLGAVGRAAALLG
jgi:cytochrome P450